MKGTDNASFLALEGVLKSTVSLELSQGARMLLT